MRMNVHWEGESEGIFPLGLLSRSLFFTCKKSSLNCTIFKALSNPDLAISSYQTVLRYNILPLKNMKTFSLSVEMGKARCEQLTSPRSLSLAIHTR